MAAPTKVTNEQKAEIRRRRRNGETCASIGADLDIPHQTVSKHDRQEIQREAVAAEEAARAAAACQEWLDAINAWTVSFDPNHSGPLFHSPEQRLHYYWQRRLKSNDDYCTYNTACRQWPLKAEKRAMRKGRKLFLHDSDPVFPDR